MLRATAPFKDFEALVDHLAGEEAGRAKRALTAGLALTDALWNLPTAWRNGVVVLPKADMSRFGCDLETNRSPAEIDSDSYERLIRFEVERASSLLDGSATALAGLNWRQLVAAGWQVGAARAKLASLAKHPNRLAGAGPKPFVGSQIVGAYRAIRRVSLRTRSAAVLG